MPNPVKPDAAAKTAKLLASLWTRNLPIIEERLALLDQAAHLAGSGTLTAPLRREAAATAHKLAGSLGMFGYAKGTEIARSLELLFDDLTDPAPSQLSDLALDLRRSLRL